LSYRSHIWTDTDPDRTGMLDFVFEDGFGYERYVDYILDVPMYFAYRNGDYVDLSGQSFRRFMDRGLDALPGERPTLRDWDLVKDFSMEERHALRDGVPRHALKLPFRGGTVRDLAQRALEISAAGLQRRARVNANGADERIFLTPLMEFADANETPAQRKLSLFHGDWNGNIDPVFQEFAY